MPETPSSAGASGADEYLGPAAPLPDPSIAMEWELRLMRGTRRLPDPPDVTAIVINRLIEPLYLRLGNALNRIFVQSCA